MSIVSRATAEMLRAGHPPEEIYAMQQILRKFFDTWDSGGAVSIMVPVLLRLLNGQPLTPLTGEDDEWSDPIPSGDLLQNVRCSSVFKNRHNGKCFDSDESGDDPITFPYYPPTRLPPDPVYEVDVDMGEPGSDQTVTSTVITIGSNTTITINEHAHGDDHHDSSPLPE